MTSLGYCILHEHDLRLLALAVGLTALTLPSASILIRRAGRRNEARPTLWVMLGALCVSCGIWSIHFIGMLAYLPGVPVTFDLADTVLSLALIMAGAAASFRLAHRAARPAPKAAAGAGFGLAVAAMHYVGMRGFDAPGRLVWDGGGVLLSTAYVVVLAALAFALGVGARGERIARWRLPVAGGVLALGVLLLHFTGMSAVRLQFDPTVALHRGWLSRPLLALAVAAVASLGLGVGVCAAYQEHRRRRRSLQRLRLLSASSFEGVALLHGGRVVEANPCFVEMTGVGRAALIGRSFLHEVFVPDEGQALAEDGRTEGLLRAAGGRMAPVEVLSRAVGSGADRTVAVRDLTERRHKEESLSLLFHRNPAPVWVADKGGRVRACNPAACDLYGYAEADFLRLEVRQLLSPDEHGGAAQLTPEEGGRYSAERAWRHLRADGSEILVLPYCESISFGGEPASLCTVFDVTERERSARALQAAKEAAEGASRAKSTFLANMSHEIRTPLNGVIGMSQAIAAGELSPLQRQRLEVVLRSGQALLHLLNDVLDVSKIEAGRMELEEVDFDLRTLVTEVELLFRVQAEGKGLAFLADVAPNVAATYRGDPTRLKQILSNLVSNAVKFTREGTVAFSAMVEGDGAIRFSVYDTGEGVSPEALERLFQSFVQADASTTRRHGGTGLGLAICRDLAHLMGGEIEVESLPGQGSTFSLVVRLTPSAAPLDLAPPEPAAMGDEDGSGGAVRILAAEDNMTNQLVLRTLLAQDGVELTLVANGAEAVTAWREGGFDVLLMDVQMPVMDGPTAVRAIRCEEVRLKRPRTPIVAVTANVMSHQIDEYREAGMDAYVAKPIDLRVLFDTLDQVLSPPALAA